MKRDCCNQNCNQGRACPRRADRRFGPSIWRRLFGWILRERRNGAGRRAEDSKKQRAAPPRPEGHHQGMNMEVADIDQPENPNPDIIQDRGRQRLANLLEKGNTELLDQPPVDTTDLPPAYEQPQDQPEAADPVNSEADQTQQ